MHIRHIYEEKELSPGSTCKFDLQVRHEDGRIIKRTIKLYNLEMVIAIGFRVKSNIGNTFGI